MHGDEPKTEAEGERVVPLLTRATCAERLEVSAISTPLHVTMRAVRAVRGLSWRGVGRTHR